MNILFRNKKYDKQETTEDKLANAFDKQETVKEKIAKTKENSRKSTDPNETTTEAPKRRQEITVIIIHKRSKISSKIICKYK